MATVLVKANFARLQHDRFTARFDRGSTGWAMGIHHKEMTPAAVVDQIEGHNLVDCLRRSIRKDSCHLKRRPMRCQDSTTGDLHRFYEPIQRRLFNSCSKPLHMAMARKQSLQASPTAWLLGVEQRAQPELATVGFDQKPASPLPAVVLIQSIQIRMQVGLTNHQGEISFRICTHYGQSHVGQGLAHLLE